MSRARHLPDIVDVRADMAVAGMKAWDKAMRGEGPKTWFRVLPQVYRAMQAADPEYRALLDDLAKAGERPDTTRRAELDGGA